MCNLIEFTLFKTLSFCLSDAAHVSQHASDVYPNGIQVRYKLRFPKVYLDLDRDQLSRTADTRTDRQTSSFVVRNPTVGNKTASSTSLKATPRWIPFFV